MCQHQSVREGRLRRKKKDTEIVVLIHVTNTASRTIPYVTYIKIPLSQHYLSRVMGIGHVTNKRMKRMLREARSKVFNNFQGRGKNK